MPESRHKTNDTDQLCRPGSGVTRPCSHKISKVAMHTMSLYFDTRKAAEDHLLHHGFEFMGAPSRWRKAIGNVVLRADAISAATGCCVRFFSWRNAPNTGRGHHKLLGRAA